MFDSRQTFLLIRENRKQKHKPYPDVGAPLHAPTTVSDPKALVEYAMTGLSNIMAGGLVSPQPNAVCGEIS